MSAETAKRAVIGRIVRFRRPVAIVCGRKANLEAIAQNHGGLTEVDFLEDLYCPNPGPLSIQGPLCQSRILVVFRYDS